MLDLGGGIVVALIGLGGALIGAAAAMGAQWQANRHERRERRRHELVELVSRFWEACDRLWRAEEGLTYAVMALSNAKSGGPVAEIYEARRQDSMSRRHTAETDGLHLLAQMRILHPAIAEAATGLYEASDANLEHEQKAALTAQRLDARHVFEEAASEFLDTSRELDRERTRTWRAVAEWAKQGEKRRPRAQ